jgi:hypothetical protein
MKKLIIGLLALATLGAALPAAAHPVGERHHHHHHHRPRR